MVSFRGRPGAPVKSETIARESRAFVFLDQTNACRNRPSAQAESRRSCRGRATVMRRSCGDVVDSASLRAIQAQNQRSSIATDESARRRRITRRQELQLLTPIGEHGFAHARRNESGVQVLEHDQMPA